MSVALLIVALLCIVPLVLLAVDLFAPRALPSAVGFAARRD